jgi:iron only hydrogenase large subunit-like protein
MEATLRTFASIYGQACPNEHLYEERIIGDGIREKRLKCGEYDLKVAMIEGPTGIHNFCKGLKEGKNTEYHMVEVMFCRGGCVGGPGMPNAGQDEFISKRINVLRKYDDNSVLTSAHENPFIQEVYKSYLGKPFGKKSKEILHVKDFNVMFG